MGDLGVSPQRSLVDSERSKQHFFVQGQTRWAVSGWWQVAPSAAGVWAKSSPQARVPPAPGIARGTAPVLCSPCLCALTHTGSVPVIFRTHTLCFVSTASRDASGARAGQVSLNSRSERKFRKPPTATAAWPGAAIPIP